MYFRDLVLHTNNFEEQYKFYVEKLGFPLIEKWRAAFCIRAGITHFTFQQSSDETATPYHFAFGIKDERITMAKEYLQERVEIISTSEYPDAIVDFPVWNSCSLYFYDADNNVVEFIARNGKSSDFKGKYSILDIKSVCEIGLPVENMKKTYKQFNQKFKLQKCKGETKHFCPVGDENGMFILVDSNMKNWYPTPTPVQNADFKTVIQNKCYIGEVVSQKGKLTMF